MLLDFSRIEAGRVQMRPRRTDIAALTADVLLTDVGLAGASVIDLAIDPCRRLPHLHVVLVTGYDVALTVEQRRPLPNAIVLRKPYDVRQFLDALRTSAA